MKHSAMFLSYKLNRNLVIATIDISYSFRKYYQQQGPAIDMLVAAIDKQTLNILQLSLSFPQKPCLQMHDFYSSMNFNELI